jgi:YD repeat-containing protein
VQSSQRIAVLLLSTTVGLFMFENPARAGDKIVYTYDARGRLVAVSTTEGPHAGTNVTTTYDAADNRSGYVVTGSGTPTPTPAPAPTPTPTPAPTPTPTPQGTFH